ncbi:hypothetical protein JB92DRAFT_2921264 [Gautieria morchelliformis]|nr:hypothetical protein JB92DRAFT_2921264 [Gautieria morchelliformis]
MALPSLLKRRAMAMRMQAIKAELAARTLYVVDGEDIVITSLDRKPFCCQEELSVMSRPELCSVARELNDKLPCALRIESLHRMPSNMIRLRIEEMMGFRHLHPRVHMSVPAGQAFTDFGTLLSHQGRGKRSPTSSFSSSSSRSSVPYRLAVVSELDEESIELPWSASKPENSCSPAPTRYRVSVYPGVQGSYETV